MSNIPQARAIIEQIAGHYARNTAAHILAKKALRLMMRNAPAKRAKGTRVNITAAIRAAAAKMAAQGKTHHEIAETLGLRNGGRVSEIINGKR